ncbi:MAG: histidinol-phosphatase HisJ family protein [Solirubrobacterales bacterium]
MLTDYHTHLRPDEREATAKRHFTEDNVKLYLRAAADVGVGELGFSEHVHRFGQALDVWDHPFWKEQAVDDLDAYVEFVQGMKAAGHAVKLGLEVDYVSGKEEQIADLLADRPWDYVIGSVHFIGDRAVDHSEYGTWSVSDADQVWSEYFRSLGAAAASGLYDILAHPDLVKVWGSSRPKPDRDPRFFYELAIESIAGSNVAVEVSTAGLRKPIEEIYPTRELLDMLLEAGRPVALSSDAHLPEQIGFGYDRAVEYLREAGVGEICVFEERRRTMEPLG